VQDSVGVSLCYTCRAGLTTCILYRESCNLGVTSCKGHLQSDVKHFLSSIVMNVMFHVESRSILSLLCLHDMPGMEGGKVCAG